MKDRIFKNWNFIRILYLAMGLLIVIQAIAYKQWPMILAGGYFAAMGLFHFGCAAGNCFSGACENKTNNDKIAKEQ